MVKKAKSAAPQSTSQGRSKARRGPGRKPASQAKRKQGARRDEDEEDEEEATPVVGGRLVAAAAIMVAMVIIPFSPLANVIEKKAPEPSSAEDWKVGEKATVHVTLVTADYDRLVCGSDEQFGRYRCAATAEGKPSKPPEGAVLDDNKRYYVQPYRTHPDNRLIMIAGLWAEPSVATRLHDEPSLGVAANKLARFVAECEVEFIGKMKNPKLRWNPGQDWINEGDALVAKPLECNIISPE